MLREIPLQCPGRLLEFRVLGFSVGVGVLEFGVGVYVWDLEFRDRRDSAPTLSSIAKSAHVRESRPDHGLGFHLQVLKSS